jgi:hypothetical protein
MTTKETILIEASRIVDGDREQTYGHPAKNFENTALIWSGILGIPVSVNQVALCMVGLKLARQAHEDKRDNLVDGAGYLRCIEKAQDAGYPIMKKMGGPQAFTHADLQRERMVAPSYKQWRDDAFRNMIVEEDGA